MPSLALLALNFQDGLGVAPKIAAWACEGLLHLGMEDRRPLAEAVVVGRSAREVMTAAEPQRTKAQAMGGNVNAAKRRQKKQ